MGEGTGRDDCIGGHLACNVKIWCNGNMLEQMRVTLQGLLVMEDKEPEASSSLTKQGF